ncbi:N/A [soil metagenome]
MCKSDQIHSFEDTIVANRKRALNFILSKVSDPQVAEDILQDSMLKALDGIDSLKDETKAESWFYQIIRNRITDHYRRSGTKEKALNKLAVELEANNGEEFEKNVCGCFHDIIPTLKPDYAVLIKEMELGNEQPETVAGRLGITRNTLKVRRFRARQQLQKFLELTCGVCATQGCLDCTCT